MKINWNSKYLTIAAYAAGTIVVSALVVMAFVRMDTVSEKLTGFTAIATPVIIGIFCAYLLNPLMMKFERGLFKKWAASDNQKLKSRARILSLTLTMIVVLAALVLIIILVIPQLITNIITVFSNMPVYIANVQEILNKVAEENPSLAEFLDNPLEDLNKFFTDLWNKYSGELLNFAGNIAAGIWTTFDALKNIFFGLTLSVYLLAKKEMFVGQTKKMLFAFVKPDRAQRLLNVCRKASEKFLGSIIGKIIDSFVVAVLTFICCVIMRMPYAPLMAIIMFVFQLIPVVGAIIGCIPCCLLLLLSGNPWLALWFFVIVMVMQTIDGNFIGPLILGDSTGLPAVWILISILIGGGLFGIPGMLLGVPVFAVIYMLFKDFVENRLKKRKLPCNTDKYVGNVDYITKDYVFEGEEPDDPPHRKKSFSFFKKKLGNADKEPTDKNTKAAAKNKEPADPDKKPAVLEKKPVDPEKKADKK